MNKILLKKWIKPLLFVLCLIPLGLLIAGVALNTLGANPAEALVRATGDWTLRFLCITLAITPMRVIMGWSALARFRRMVGLFTFFYGCLHFLAFSWLDMGLDIEAIIADIAKRPFILVGTLGLLSMLPLAATSFNRAIKWMGAKKWQTLHKLVYISALLGVLHFFWMRSGKNDFAAPLVYAGIIGGLLLWRLWHYTRKKSI